MTVQNTELSKTLQEAVKEVLNLLTGLDLTYEPELDRFYAITRLLNRALRLNATENNWSWYASTEEVGILVEGQTSVYIDTQLRPRITTDDACYLQDADGMRVLWAYFLPRQSIHKYQARSGLWVAHVRDELVFSRAIREEEDGLTFHVPCMREPDMFVLPEQSEDPLVALTEVPSATLTQEIDFPWPDLITARAAHLYAQTDPVMQPRVQTLEAAYKDLMYQLLERDTNKTDTPFMNDWFVPMQGSLAGADYSQHYHPHADERRY